MATEDFLSGFAFGDDMLTNMSDTDLQLLRRYARQYAEDAFAELVHRHLNLVFSVAFRQVRSAQLAEEIAQSVFIDLSRNAECLEPNTILTAWLYQVTTRTAIDVVRREVRRTLREQVAVELTTMNTSAADWTAVGPLLDEAMNALDDGDRTAVLLRYFENKSFREVGEMLSTTEEAARKRLSRAIDRLREFFTKRGVTVEAGGLAALISANSVQAAPAGLAAAITAAALSGATVSATSALAATKGIAMTTLQKALIAGTLTVVVGTGIYEARRAATFQAQVQTFQQQQAPLTEQIQELQRQREEAARQLVSLQASQPLELLRLRNQVGLLRQQTNALAQQLNESRSKEPIAKPSDSAVKPIPCDSCIFSGYATPEAALQTYAWAVTKGNLKAYLDCFAPAARDEAAKEFQGKSEGEILGMLVGKLHSAGALRLDRMQTLEDGAVEYPLQSTTRDDGLITSTVAAMIRFRNVAGEWRLGESGQ